MKYAPRANRYERRQMHAAKLASDMGGTGIYVFENNTDGDLKLPKATVGGLKTIGPRKRFQGDSYFLIWVGSPMNLLRLIEEIKPKMTTQEIADKISQEQGTVMTEQKLILDQPDTITNKGKIEHVVANDQPLQSLNDACAAKPNKDILISENPLDGIAIIKG